MRERLPAGRARFFFPFFLLGALSLACLSCVKLSRRMTAVSGQTAPPASQIKTTSAPLININTASSEQLEKLPGIGRALASRIVAHRSEYGRFRRPEHLMMVRGISVRRFRAMRPLITVE
jgi:competence ComEA-like helix-hairpin-helix protein